MFQELHLQQLHNILKKPADLAELSQTCYSQPNRSNQLIKNEKKTLNKTGTFKYFIKFYVTHYFGIRYAMCNIT